VCLPEDCCFFRRSQFCRPHSRVTSLKPPDRAIFPNCRCWREITARSIFADRTTGPHCMKRRPTTRNPARSHQIFFDGFDECFNSNPSLAGLLLVFLEEPQPNALSCLPDRRLGQRSWNPGSANCRSKLGRGLPAGAAAPRRRAPGSRGPGDLARCVSFAGHPFGRGSSGKQTNHASLSAGIVLRRRGPAIAQHPPVPRGLPYSLPAAFPPGCGSFENS